MSGDSKLAKREDSSKKMKNIEEVYKDDPDLLEFSKTNLIEPGWAGELAPYELAYIKSELKKSPKLRRCWGFQD